MARLIVLQKTSSPKQVNVHHTPFVIGRADSCDLTLDDPLVSRNHAVIESVVGGSTIRDMQSHNGTRVNGERVKIVMLKNGDEIRIGGSKLRFLTDEGPNTDLDALRLVSKPTPLALVDPDIEKPEPKSNTPFGG